MRLYDISADLRDALESFEVDPETGEVLLDAARIEALEVDMDGKLEGCAVVLKELRADIDALKAEEEAMKARRMAVERRYARLRDYVAGCMETAAKTRYSGPKGSITLRRSKAVELCEGFDAPGYMVERVTRTPDKAAIRAALEAGEKVDGAAVVEHVSAVVK
jgi:hypothetical protein